MLRARAREGERDSLMQIATSVLQVKSVVNTDRVRPCLLIYGATTAHVINNNDREYIAVNN